MNNSRLNNKIENWVSALTERLIEIRFFDVEDIKISLKTHFEQAMIECLSLQQSENQKKHNELKLQLPYIFGQKKQKLQAELSQLNDVIKRENILLSDLDNDRKAKELTLWMRKHHNESLNEFYIQYDFRFPKNKTNG